MPKKSGDRLGKVNGQNRFHNFLKGWAFGLVGGYLLVFAHILKVMTIRAYGCENIVIGRFSQVPALLSFIPDILLFIGAILLVLAPFVFWVIIPLANR